MTRSPGWSGSGPGAARPVGPVCEQRGLFRWLRARGLRRAAVNCRGRQRRWGQGGFKFPVGVAVGDAQIQTVCSGSSRIARVVLAMLSAPSSRSLPMARFRKAAIARGALPDGGGLLGEHHISDTVAGIFDSPVLAHVSAQYSRAGLVGIEAGDGVDRLPDLTLAALLAAPVDAQCQPRFRESDPSQVRRDGHGRSLSASCGQRAKPRPSLRVARFQATSTAHRNRNHRSRSMTAGIDGSEPSRPRREASWRLRAIGRRSPGRPGRSSERSPPRATETATARHSGHP